MIEEVKKMTNEQKVKDAKELVSKHGFKYEGKTTCEGSQIFTRKWEKKVDVAWYGEMTSTLEIEYDMIYGESRVSVIRDGRYEKSDRFPNI